MVMLFTTGELSEEQMDRLNKETAIIMDAKYKEAYGEALKHSYEAATMFDDWWHGGYVFNDEYKSCIPHDCYEHGRHIIMWVTSQGFG
ncbi:hypothetical protein AARONPHADGERS_125 [Bacillus phage AaronPhadgers]|nr:hypothetical protein AARONPHADGERS_125 [Bacillus phage AaronPhadgers]